MNSQDPVGISVSTTQPLPPELELTLLISIATIISLSYLLRKKHQTLVIEKSTIFFSSWINTCTLLVDIHIIMYAKACGCTYEIILYIYRDLNQAVDII